MNPKKQMLLEIFMTVVVLVFVLVQIAIVRKNAVNDTAKLTGTITLIPLPEKDPAKGTTFLYEIVPHEKEYWVDG